MGRGHSARRQPAAPWAVGPGPKAVRAPPEPGLGPGDTDTAAEQAAKRDGPRPGPLGHHDAAAPGTDARAVRVHPGVTKTAAGPGPPAPVPFSGSVHRAGRRGARDRDHCDRRASHSDRDWSLSVTSYGTRLGHWHWLAT